MEEECKHEMVPSSCAECNGDAAKLDKDFAEARHERLDRFRESGVWGGLFGGGSSR